jgi:hypothetical protein
VQNQFFGKPAEGKDHEGRSGKQCDEAQCIPEKGIGGRPIHCRIYVPHPIPVSQSMIARMPSLFPMFTF